MFTSNRGRFVPSELPPLPRALPRSPLVRAALANAVVIPHTHKVTHTATAETLSALQDSPSFAEQSGGATTRSLSRRRSLPPPPLFSPPPLSPVSYPPSFVETRFLVRSLLLIGVIPALIRPESSGKSIGEVGPTPRHTVRLVGIGRRRSSY